MPVINFPPPLPKVFTLRTPQHWLGKLHWEINSLKRTEGRASGIFSNLIASYQATNCAITAWHMVDWIWEYCSPGEQRDLANRMGLERPKIDCFVAYIRNASPALNSCREIATASKHHRITRGQSNPYIDTHYGFIFQKARIKGAVKRVGRLMVMDGERMLLARDLFAEAFGYWDHYLRHFGFTEDRFISADPRSGSRSRIKTFKKPYLEPE